MDDYDALSPSVQADPYPHFSRFHSSCPVHHQDIPGAGEPFRSSTGTLFEPSTEFYQLFGYPDIVSALQNHNVFSSALGPGRDRITPPNKVGMLIYADRPHHRMQRQIVNKALNGRMVTRWEPRVRQIVDDLIDGFAARGRAELNGEFAVHVPGTLFCEMLGVPASDDHLFLGWVRTIATSFSGDPEAHATSVKVMSEFADYFGEIIARRRKMIAGGAELPDDLMTALLTSDYEGRTFDDVEMILALQILVVGGHDTTATSFINGIALLCEHRDQYRLLISDLDLLPNAIEETLRFDTQPQCLFRTNNEQVEMSGVTIPEDSKVGIMYGAGNRDPAFFADGDRFDITRDPRKVRHHLTFGTGIHSCPGAGLARMQLQVAFEAILRRLPNLRFDDDLPRVREDNMMQRQWGSLPVRWDT